MKVLLRIVLFLLALCLLAGLLAILSVFTAIPWVSGFVQGLLAAWPWLPLALAVVLLFCMAATVLGLVLILSVPSKRRLLVLGRENGNIEITRQSVESTAGASLDEIPELKRYHVQAKGDMRPGRLKLEVQAEPRGGLVDMAQLAAGIQQRLAADLAGCLAMDPKHIHVRIQPIHQQQEGRRQHSKVPRVV